MTARAMWLEIRDELLGILREPTALFFSVLMPVGFYTFFAAVFGNQGGDIGTEAIVPFGTFGVLAVVLMNPGIGMADARQRGWLRVKRVSGIPLWMTVTAKVIASIPYALAVLAAITTSAVFVGGMQFEPAEVAAVYAVLILGVLPFAFFSLAIGSRAGTNASAAILNAILMPSAIASGLWFPYEMLPDIVARIGSILPTYHLAQLAMVPVDGGAWLGHLLVLAATAALGAIVATMAYRTARL
ncbi:MAG TPA: ABC transporter permease [Acidimicrobiia bacterium]|jgi:ABC-2 type transport system permease protein